MNMRGTIIMFTLASLKKMPTCLLYNIACIVEVDNNNG